MASTTPRNAGPTRQKALPTSSKWSADVAEWSTDITEWSADVAEWSADVAEWSADVAEWSADVAEWPADVVEMVSRHCRNGQRTSSKSSANVVEIVSGRRRLVGGRRRYRPDTASKGSPDVSLRSGDARRGVERRHGQVARRRR